MQDDRFEKKLCAHKGSDAQQQVQTLSYVTGIRVSLFMLYPSRFYPLASNIYMK